VNGAVDIGESALLVALLASTLLNAGYFVPVLFNAFFRSPDPGDHVETHKEAPLAMVVPLFFTAIASVLLGLYPEVFMQFINILTGW
jgi:multicomponent Na+:H+ antiporter subunit D